MPTLRVTAPLVLVRDERGRTVHVYENGVIEAPDADHAAYLLSQGMAVLADGTRHMPVAPHPGEPDGAEASDGDPDAGFPRPPHVAAKERWVDYAVAQGFSEAEATAMTKAQLISTLS